MSAAGSRRVLDRPAREPDAVLRYADHADGVVDVRLPEPRGESTLGAAPVVVLLHGGFWRAEWDRRHIRPLADGLAALGAVVLTPEYRRTGAPDGGWPGTFDDIAAMLDALPRLRAETGAAGAAPVALVGHSAGGHLALWGAARHRLPTTSRWYAPQAYPLAGIVGLAPVSDVAYAAEADLDGGAAVALLGGARSEVPERYAKTDPMQLLPIGRRVAVLHGTADPHVPVEMSRAFAAAAQAAGDDVRLRVLPDVEHFALIDPLSPVWPDVRAALEWVRAG